MEGIIGIIVLIVGWAILVNVLKAGAKTIGAAGKAALGKGSFSDNMDHAFKGMEPFQIQISEINLGEDGLGSIAFELQGKGLMDISTPTNIGFITSVFDVTSGEWKAVISAIEPFREKDSIAFQHLVPVGMIGSGQGFISWVRLGVVIPEILEPPFSGKRTLKALVRMIDLDNPPSIHQGFHSKDETGILWTGDLNFDYEFSDKGYEEASEHRDEAVGLSLKVGMAIAMADGALDDTEGEILKNWIVRAISPFSDEKRERLKKIYNDALQSAYKEASAGELSLSMLTERLNEIGEKSTKYETIELCFEVMAADGVADEKEMKVLMKVAEALELDMEEISKLRDQTIVGLDASVSEQAGIETLLGIEPSWSQAETKKHLNTEFQKWNNRLNTLSEGAERDNAHSMLEKIAEARKKYV
jgi:hypothetical protein